jgi:hypothetical protein
MAVPDSTLADRARAAYERGRVRAALPTVALVVPMVALSVVVCRRDAVSLIGGGLLAALLLGALWRGGPLARGARAGLTAGTGALLLPMAATCLHVCAGGICLLAPSACVTAGALAGAAVGVAARRREAAGAGTWAYLAPALLVAGLAGALGCVIAGLAGVVGMAIAMGLTVAPVLWWPSRTA